MPRVPEITQRDEVPEGERHHYDAIMASRNNRPRPYSFLLHCPDLAARTAHLVGYSLHVSDFPKDQKELAICAVAREFDCAYAWASHERDARNAGVREEAILSIRDRKAPQGLTEEEAQIVRYVQELLRPPHHISDSTFRALHNRLGDVRIVELTGIIGAYAALACSLNALEVPVAEGRPVLPVESSRG